MEKQLSAPVVNGPGNGLLKGAVWKHGERHDTVESEEL
jgi:hypothetical protein